MQRESLRSDVRDFNDEVDEFTTTASRPDAEDPELGRVRLRFGRGLSRRRGRGSRSVAPPTPRDPGRGPGDHQEHDPDRDCTPRTTTDR